jgi:cell shape-determining protein MreC
MGAETQLVMSLGSIFGLVGLFYTFHKDSKDTAKQIQKLETEVETLKEHKQDIKEIKQEIDALKTTTGSIQLTLARIDTNVQHLMEER